MPSKSPVALPFERLFVQLQSAGFPMDTRRKLRLWRALRLQGADYAGRIDELKYLLAPLIATNGAEQQRFYKLFEEFLAECAREAVDFNETEPPPPLKTRQGHWFIAGMVLATLAVALIAWLFYGPVSQPVPPLFIDKSPVETQLLREDSTLLLQKMADKTDDGPLRWEIRDAGTGEPEYSDTSRQLRWKARLKGADKWIVLRAEHRLPDSVLVHVHCSNPPKLDTVIWPVAPLVQRTRYRFAVKTEAGMRVYWVFDGRDTLYGARVDTTFEQNGQHQAACIVARPGEEGDCYTRSEKVLTVGSDQPFMSLAELQYDEPRLIRRLAFFLWFLLLIPLLGAAWFFDRWWRKRQAEPTEKSADKLAADYPIHDRAPYFVPYRPQEQRMGGLDAFYRMAEVLSRREEDERRTFDAPASVEATIAGGGFPAWRERVQTSPPDYLFLVTRATERDQLGRLFERLSTFLKKQDAPLTTFFHDGSFRRFWNPEHQQGVTLDWLGQHYGEHQLVLLGNAHALLNPYDTRRPTLLATAAPLLRWRKRLLLTPAPVAGWSYQEALLHQTFPLYPADTDGLLAGFEALDALDAYEAGPYALSEAQLSRRRTDTTDRYRNWQDLAAHSDYLQADPGAFRWLCGLAVTTQPDYALTLAIGQALGVEVSHDRLLRLFRIPWLSSNEPVNALRLALLAQLSAEDERLARQAAAAELEAVKDRTAGSFAETDWRVNLAIHRFALEPRDEAHKQVLRELLQLGLLSGSQVAELDWVVQKRADASGLPAGSTDNLDTWLGLRPPRPFWMTELRLALGCLALAAVLAIAGWLYNDRQAEQTKLSASPLVWWQAERVVDDEALRLHNQAVGIGKRLSAMDKYGDWQAGQDSLGLVDSLLAQALALRDGNYPLAYRNKAAFEYNVPARRLNFFLADSAGVEELQRTGSGPLIPKFSPTGPASPLVLAIYHCYGLSNYYLSKEGNDNAYYNEAMATRAYTLLLQQSDSTFFDSIRATMPINLQTLLAADGLINQPEYALQLLILDGGTRQPIPKASLKALQLRSDRDGRLHYMYPKDAAAPRFTATITAAGYPAWRGMVTPRSDGRTDTIFLQASPPPDRDSDGVPDAQDKCPEEPGPINNAGCPEPTLADSDGDGVPNATDKCPDERGTLEYKGCIPPADPVQRLAVEKPSEALIRAALQGFKFDSTGSANDTEADSILRLIGVTRPQRRQLNAEIFYTGLLPSGFSVTIWVGTYEKTDRYGLRYGAADLSYFPSNETYFELIKPAATAVPLLLPAMVFVPGGSLRLGCTDEQGKDCSDDENPPHTVTLSDFYLSRTEVTNAEFAAFLNAYGSPEVTSGEYKGQTMIYENDWGIRFPSGKGAARYAPQPGYEQYPVVNVTWYGASEYGRWLSTRTGQRYALPTEAEWEYAARGGAAAAKRAFKYAGSDNLDEVAWYTTNSDRHTQPVARKKANALGLHDMSGNVWEWCADWYGQEYYKDLKNGTRNPQGPDTGTSRVLRGGSWNSFQVYCRVSYRNGFGPESWGSYVGFRLARH